MFVYDLYDLESAGFSVVANQLNKDRNLNWSREVVLIIHVVVGSFLFNNYTFQTEFSGQPFQSQSIQ